MEGLVRYVIRARLHKITVGGVRTPFFSFSLSLLFACCCYPFLFSIIARVLLIREPIDRSRPLLFEGLES